MKLITHNMLTSNGIKNVTKGFPLKINAEEVDTVEVDFNKDFITKMLSRLDWPALKSAAENLGHGEDLPAEAPKADDTDEEVFQKIHHVLMEIEVIKGDLECPETGRKFRVDNGIPNMLLNEDEV